MGQPMATIENVAEDLCRALNSIQAIAYYVEMTLPLSEMASFNYLRKLQELVDECHESLQPFVQGCRAAGNEVSEAIETNPNSDIGVESKYVNAHPNGREIEGVTHENMAGTGALAVR
jgi:hypothetical protein